MTEEELFANALDLPEAERADFLAQASADDEPLRKRVEALLAIYNPADRFLESPVAANGDTGPFLPKSRISEPNDATEKPGSRIGPYRLLEQIGEGGFGFVYMAEQQQPVRRKVALKIVKPGMDTRQVVARFEAERQALALMDHPNIAHVFDGGETESGRPYFVMELVRGIPITDYCDQDHVPIRGRLELFINVCQAVQHAHQKGIIHRDLKPSNILITLHDGTPVVKVIDFGIAKATGQQLTDKTLFTNFAQFIGTPMYMSPEQAALSGLDVDTRSDIYALGVLLYELLAGTTPFDKEKMRTAAYDEIRRIIREEEPQRPSTRLTTFASDTSVVCANRRSDAKQLSQMLRGELDWIVLKAIEKDRNRRYESAGAFAADVQRYLHDEPVHACPPTLAYRMTKLMRRYKGPVLAASIIALALIGGIVGTTWGLFRATAAKADAVWEAQQKQLALQDKETALESAQKSERNATDQLFQSLLSQARAERTSNRVGQRFNALRAVRQATQIRITPELRAEAAAALVLPDLELLREWKATSQFGFVLDASFERYARLDKEGGITIGRLTRDGEEMTARLPPHGVPLFRGLLMSDDGRFVAYGHSGAREGLAGAVRVWKLDGPAPEVWLDEPLGFHDSAMFFHRNNRMLALGHVDGTVSVFDLNTRERLHRFSVGAAPAHLAFHPRDGRLAIASNNGVRIFDTHTGQERPALRHESPSPSITYVDWHPDGRRLAASGNDLKIHIWDADLGREVMPAWVGHPGYGLGAVFNQTGDRLMSGDWSGPRRLWDVATGKLLLTIPGSVVLRFGPDDRLIEHVPDDYKVRMWQLANGREMRTMEFHGDERPEFKFNPMVHPNGRIVAASTEYWLVFFDLKKGTELASIRLPLREAAMPVGFDPSGGMFTGGWGGFLQWPTRTDTNGTELLHIGPPVDLAAGLASSFFNGSTMSRDCQLVALPLGNHGAELIDRRRSNERRHLGPQYDVRSAIVSPDGKLAVTCSHWHDGKSESVRIWNTATGRLIHALPFEGYTGAQFSPDGRWLATYGVGGVRMWDVATWKEERQFRFATVAFSPDSKLMALSAGNGLIRLIAVESGLEVARLTGPESKDVAPACFTPDGAALISTGDGRKSIHVWDLRLIRAQLKEMGLDWDWPEFRIANPNDMSNAPAKIEIHLGDLAETGPLSEKAIRRSIDHYRATLDANPENAEACNGLAWNYLTGPAAVRDVKAALPLAEKAVRLAPTNAMFINTLGVAYYHDGQYRKAIDTLRPNLEKQVDSVLAFDLIFLAMSHHRLGEFDRAQDYHNWALRWMKSPRGLSTRHHAELKEFQAEAEKLMNRKP